jgi:hypothetical protein
MGFLQQAVETLKTFEKKDSRVKSAAATNLSFLYVLVRLSLSDLTILYSHIREIFLCSITLAYFLELYGVSLLVR